MSAPGGDCRPDNASALLVRMLDVERNDRIDHLPPPSRRVVDAVPVHRLPSCASVFLLAVSTYDGGRYLRPPPSLVTVVWRARYARSQLSPGECGSECVCYPLLDAAALEGCSGANFPGQLIRDSRPERD